MTIFPTAYQVKRVLLSPRILLGRFRERNQPEIIKRALDETNYRRHTYDFIDAKIGNQTILHDLGAQDSEIVLDVGAFAGEWTREAAKLSSGAEFHLFEVSPIALAHLSRTMSNRPNIQIHPYGLAASDEDVEVSRLYAGSSIKQRSRGETTDPGQTRDVVEAWAQLQLGSVAAMKINIEGGEYELLERMAEADLIPQVRTYLIQFHEWVRGSHRARRRIRRQLAKSHEVVWEYPFAWERWDRIDRPESKKHR